MVLIYCHGSDGGGDTIIFVLHWYVIILWRGTGIGWPAHGDDRAHDAGLGVQLTEVHARLLASAPSFAAAVQGLLSVWLRVVVWNCWW